MRLTAQMTSAPDLADLRAGHPAVTSVQCLGRRDDTDAMCPTYRRQRLGAGALVSSEVVGGEPGAFRFLNALKLVHLAVSLGGTESLAEHPATMTHADLPLEERERMGITPGLVRGSVGVEHYEDIVRDIAQALEAV